MGRVHQAFENPPMQAQDDERRPDGGLGVGEVPHRPLNIADMCRAFGISRATFYRWKDAHVFDAFRLLPVVGKERWNGVKVAQWRRGESTLRPIFGRKR